MTCILIVGVSGWLGQFVWQSVQSRYDPLEIDLHGAYSTSIPHFVPEEKRFSLDLADRDAIFRCIERLKPHAIIHVAAMSSPAAAHRDAERAHAVNCPSALIAAVRLHVPDALLIYTSTDLVYDGEHAPYAAMPRPALPPTTIYGASKLSFEALVTELPRGVVLRLSNMIGPSYAYQPVAAIKFLNWLHGAFARRERVGLWRDEFRSFVHVQDVLDVISTILDCVVTEPASPRVFKSEEVFRKVFNLGGPVPLSRLELARIVAAAQGVELLELAVGQAIDEKVDLSKTWVVNSVSLESMIPAGGFVNPRNVTMDSSATESVFRLKFAPMDAVVPAILDTFKKT